MSIISLVERAKAEDNNAKQEIIDKYIPLIKSQIFKYKHIEGYDYDDLMQYGVVSILKGIKEFKLDKSNSFGGYIKWTIMNNFAYLCRRENNEKKKASSLNVTNEEGYEIIDILEDDETIEKIYMENMDVQRILDAIEKLELEERELCKYLINDGESKSLKEYSNDLKIPYHKILYRKKQLAKSLKNILEKI